ncbi:MAG TPA: hypothetical protein VF953_08830 [Terriglobales bacterium]
MKLGVENRKEVIALAVLGVIAAVTTTSMFWPSATPLPAPAAPQTTSANSTRAAVRRTASGKFVKASEPRLDPTLDLDLLRQSEQIKYAGNARNIFVAGSPVPHDNGSTDHKKVAEIRQPPPVPPPPPINLKFFGFANKPGEPKKVFLSQDGDIFIATEGDIVNRRYRVLHISPAAVDIEDVLNNNRQSIPLTQG